MAETRESFVSFWRNVASTFSGQNGVFGYELMNEPWAGNVVEDLSLMLPGVSGRRNLAPLYERVSELQFEISWMITGMQGQFCRRFRDTASYSI